MVSKKKKKPAKKKARKFTERQKRFIKEYPIDLNLTKAAERAGFSKKTAYSAGQRLLKNVEIFAAIQKELEKRSIRTEITQDRVLKELATLSFSNVNDYVIDDDGNIELAPGAPADAMQAVSSIKRRITYDKDGEKTVTTELRLWNKPVPLKISGKHVGLKAFFDRIEVTGKDGGPVKAAVGLTQEDLDRIEEAIVGPKDG